MTCCLLMWMSASSNTHLNLCGVVFFPTFCKGNLCTADARGWLMGWDDLLLPNSHRLAGPAELQPFEICRVCQLCRHAAGLLGGVSSNHRCAGWLAYSFCRLFPGFAGGFPLVVDLLPLHLMPQQALRLMLFYGMVYMSYSSFVTHMLSNGDKISLVRCRCCRLFYLQEVTAVPPLQVCLPASVPSAEPGWWQCQWQQPSSSW